jgi:hypothetical protein
MARFRAIMPRFVAGNTAAKGHGRPRAVPAAYLDVVAAQCPLTAWARIVRKAVTDAEGGDGRARSWLSERLLPDPAAATITDGPDVAQIADLVSEWLPDPEHARRFAMKVVRSE